MTNLLDYWPISFLSVAYIFFSKRNTNNLRHVSHSDQPKKRAGLDSNHHKEQLGFQIGLSAMGLTQTFLSKSFKKNQANAKIV